MGVTAEDAFPTYREGKDMERYRVAEGGGIYFFTFSVVEWLPVFAEESPCIQVCDALNVAHHRLGLRTVAYVIMPTHLHLVCFEESFQPDGLSKAATSFRKYTGRALTDYSRANLPPHFERTLRNSAARDRRHRFWQPSRHPEVLYTERFFRQKVDYLHDNPVRKGLVSHPTQWRFSSASFWDEDQMRANDVILTGLDW